MVGEEKECRGGEVERRRGGRRKRREGGGGGESVGEVIGERWEGGERESQRQHSTR